MVLGRLSTLQPPGAFRTCDGVGTRARAFVYLVLVHKKSSSQGGLVWRSCGACLGADRSGDPLERHCPTVWAGGREVLQRK